MKQVFAKVMSIGLASIAMSTQGHVAYASVAAPGTYRIEIEVSPEEREALSKGTKSEVPSASLVIYENTSEGTTKTKSYTVNINTRGVTSLSTYPRKNFNVKSLAVGAAENGLKAKAPKMKIGKIDGKKLVLSASPEDILGTKNMVAYGLLDAVGVRALKPQYAEVVLNGESQGLYFVTRTAGDEILDSKVEVKSVDGAKVAKVDNDYDVVIRRRYGDTFDATFDPKTKEWDIKGLKKGLSSEVVRKYVDTLKKIHLIESSGDDRDEDRYAALEKNLNLTNYMKWMALAYIMQNGDYSDEVFFFGKTTASGEIMFDIMPWDQDDTFGEQMHQANLLMSINHGMEALADRTLVYNFESRIDRAIATNPVLKRKYMNIVKKMITDLQTKGTIRAVVEKVKAKLTPYMANEEIMKSGEVDKAKATYVKESILTELDSRVAFLETRMKKAEVQVDMNLSKSDNDQVETIGAFKEKFGQLFLDTMAKVEARKAKKVREAIRAAQAEEKKVAAQDGEDADVPEVKLNKEEKAGAAQEVENQMNEKEKLYLRAVDWQAKQFAEQFGGG